MEFLKFPSIESFSHVWKTMHRRLDPAPVLYGAKIKLHGTNAAVRLVPATGNVTAQSRTRDITPDMDNAGFATWVKSTEAAWRMPNPEMFDQSETITYFGEWAGRGVQKNDAVTKLDKKYFFIFAVQTGNEMITDPTDIAGYIPELDDVLVLPWFCPPFVIDFRDSVSAEAIVAQLNEYVEAIGEVDPFIKEIFEIEGQGEGLVIAPVATGDSPISRDDYSDLIFKAKSEAHRVKASEKAISVRMSIPADVLAFVETFVTDARCMQALTEACDGVPEKARTPDFLKWIGNDVRKESVVELEEMGVEWKAVAGMVSKAAVTWFMRRCERPFADAA